MAKSVIYTTLSGDVFALDLSILCSKTTKLYGDSFIGRECCKTNVYGGLNSVLM